MVGLRKLKNNGVFIISNISRMKKKRHANTKKYELSHLAVLLVPMEKCGGQFLNTVICTYSCFDFTCIHVAVTLSVLSLCVDLFKKKSFNM